MYRQIMWDYSNPYVTKTNKEFFRMVCKYDLEQISEMSFCVCSERHLKTYAERKNALRDFAIMWQRMFSEMTYYWSDIAEWSNFFEEYGKRYGLLTEFRENGIC